MSRWNTVPLSRLPRNAFHRLVALLKGERERDDIAEAQAGSHVVQGGQVVADIVGAVLVVVIHHAEYDGAIPVAGGVEIAEHVVPGAGVGAGDSGVAEDESGGRRLFIGHARIVREARVAQGDDEITAVAGLRGLLAPQDQLEDSGRRIGFEDGRVETGAKNKCIQHE